MRFDEDVFSTNANYEILLDRRKVATTKTYNSTTKKTTITLPWATTSDVEVISTDTDPTDPVSGYRHSVTKVSTSSVTVDGDITTHTVTVGIPYTFSYQFSTQYFRAGKGTGEVVVLDGRMQLRYITVEYHNTAYFQTTVKLPGRDAFTQVFNGQVTGSDTTILGQQSFSTGKHRIPVMGKNLDVVVTITNDSPFPHAFGSAEWQGIISPKSATRV